MDKSKRNYKTSICWHFKNKGYCSLYDRCYFAHGDAELRSRVDPVPAHMPPPLKPVSIFKTQLCKVHHHLTQYFMNGYCRNEDRCPFAHGPIDVHSMLVASTLPDMQYIVSPIIPPLLVAPQPAKPDYGQAGYFLFSILRNLSQVFPNYLQRQVLLKKGFELIESGDLHYANEIINYLISSNSLTYKQKYQCQTILSNAYSLHKITYGQY